MKNKNLVFAGLFKKYRLRSEIETLSEFANLMAEEGMVYAVSLYTRWQKGERVPTDRRAALAMIRIFVQRGALNSADEANELLESVGMRDLIQEEIEDIQGIFIKKAFTDYKNTLAPNNYIYYLYKRIAKKLEIIIIFSLYLILTLYWFYRPSKPFIGDFASIYFLVALVGGVIGILLSVKFKFIKTNIGKSLLMFSLGLLSQVFGQLVYSFYFYNNYSIAYPSYGDIGFFSTIPFYILGVIYLVKFLNINIKSKAFFKAIIVTGIMSAIFIITYIRLPEENIVENPSFLKTFLDFAYPIGQSIYITIAIIAFSSIKKILGKMRNKLKILIVALFCQYLSDCYFIYLAHKGTFLPGGLMDYLYLLSYFLMSISIIQFKNLNVNLELLEKFSKKK